MTEEQIEAIRNRAEKATPGCWYTDVTTFGERKYVHVQPSISQDSNEADAEFIAYAREDIPALLAEVDKLKSQVDELIGTIYEYADAGTALMDLAEVIDNANEEIR